MKRPNLKIIGIDEGEKKSQLKGTENTFNIIIEKNFHNLNKYMFMKVQGAYRLQKQVGSKKSLIVA